MSAVLICVCVCIYNTCMSARMSGAGDTLRSPLLHLTPTFPDCPPAAYTHTPLLCLTICNGQIHFSIWINTFYNKTNLDKYNKQFGQIHPAIWTKQICNLGVYFFVIQTFYPCATRHHIPELSSGNIQTLPGHVLLIPLFPLIILAYSSYLV